MKREGVKGEGKRDEAKDNIGEENGLG